MEAVIFCGIQASGKSTFYKEFFFRTHVRISLDQLNTRNKERQFLELCLKLQQRFVIDNTNPTKTERQRYIEAAKTYKFSVSCYYFSVPVAEAIQRNSNRAGKELVPEAGIRGTLKKLEKPDFTEGFDRIFNVQPVSGKFQITERIKPE